MLPRLGIATAQQETSSPQSRKTELEVEKLELEIAKLTEAPGWLQTWSMGVLGLLVGAIGVAAPVFVARRARLGALDQSVHDKRLEFYPKLVKATAQLALYFPGSGPSGASIGPQKCRTMGKIMSAWYFDKGGLLLSTDARNAYFRLARALTLASLAEELRVPIFPKDAVHISVKKVDEYREELKSMSDLDDVENWTFGGPGSEEDKPFLRFKDFVFLQRLSSALRTSLSKDLRSRRRP